MKLVLVCWFCSVLVLQSVVGADAQNVGIGIAIGGLCTACACVPILVTCSCACFCSLIYKSLKTNKKPSNTFIIQQSQLELGQPPFQLQNQLLQARSQQLNTNSSNTTHQSSLHTSAEQPASSSSLNTTVPRLPKTMADVDRHNVFQEQLQSSANRPLPDLPSITQSSLGTRSANENAGRIQDMPSPDCYEDADGYMLSDAIKQHNRSIPTVTVVKTCTSNAVPTNQPGLLTINESKLTRETHSSRRLHKSTELYATVENDYMSVIN